MKRTLALTMAAALSLAGATSAMAADHLTLQLKWVTDAQFAGYYVAKDKGFYKDAGLDVTIKPGGPDTAPEQVIAGGGADVIVDWMAAALVAREKGVPLVNIAQPFERGGLELTCWKSSGIKSPADLKGKTLGVWFYGNEYPFFAWMKKLGITPQGDKADVTVLKQAFNVDPLLQHQADCISTMSYNEYWQILEAGVNPDKLIVFKYSDEDAAMLEDGLYALQKSIDDPKRAKDLKAFVKASMKGWAYARQHPKEAVQIVLDNDATGAQTEEHQTHMMAEINKITGKTGKLNMADYDRTIKMLLDQGIIKKEPKGAYTTKITG